MLLRQMLKWIRIHQVGLLLRDRLDCDVATADWRGGGLRSGLGRAEEAVGLNGGGDGKKRTPGCSDRV